MNNKPDHFKDLTVTVNTVINDSNLSFKARGLFIFIQSRPEESSLSVEKLANFSKDGKESIRSGLKELETAGYLKRVQTYEESGQFSGYRYQTGCEAVTGQHQKENKS